MKLSERIRKRWNGLRFNQDYHLGLGDIRLTIGMQDELLDEVTQLEAENERLREAIEAWVDAHKSGYCTENYLHCTTSDGLRDALEDGE